MIELINIKKEYENVTPIKSINAVINEGDVISIIGPSGTGKSTLLRMINMLERPTEGKIIVDGDDITVPKYPLNKVREKIGMVFQNFNLFDHMTVIENVVDAPIHIKNIDKDKAYEKANELLIEVGMGDFKNQYPSSLSGGQKQRVAIARALAMEPEIILFDEPTSALDPTMVGEVQLVIRNLAKDGYTMMIVTHDMSFARSIANRVFYLDEGIIYEDGDPDTIFDNPTKDKTKDFVMGLRSINRKIDRSTYDYITYNTEIETFIYKNEIPTDVAMKLRAITEEAINGVILPYLKKREDEGEKGKVSYDISIIYSRRMNTVRMIVRYNGNIVKEDKGTFKIPMELINHYASEIVMIDEYTMKIKIKNDDK